MKTQSWLLACCSVLPLVAPSAHASPRATALPGSAVAGDLETFRKKFRQAMKINAKSEMAQLVRQDQDSAVLHIMDRVSAIPLGASAELEAEIEALREAWEASMKTGFVENVYVFYSLLDSPTQRELRKLSREYSKTFNKYLENFEPRDGATFEVVATEFERLGKAYEMLGDDYYAAICWNARGVSLDEHFRGSDARLPEAADAYVKALAAYDRIELSYNSTTQTRARLDEMIALGYTGEGAKLAGPPNPDAASGEGGGGGEAAAPKGPPPPAATPIVASMQFEVVDSLKKYFRPSYLADEIYQVWPQLYLAEKGTTAFFPPMQDLSPQVTRVGANSLMMDADRDGEPELDVPTRGNNAIFEFPIGEGDEKRQWACITNIGIQQDTYQGQQLNLISDDFQFALFYVNAGSMVGEIEGTKVRVLDDNMDGVYGNYFLTWQYDGLTEGTVQPEFDTVVVGSEKRARPFSQIMKIGDGWYELESLKGGNELKATPKQVKVGKLELDFKGGKPASVVVRGRGPVEWCFFDLLENGRGAVEVPVGEYEIFCGVVRQGKKVQTMKTLIMPGPKPTSWAVKEGETVKVTMGAPFGYDFKTKVEGDKLTVIGKSVVVTGSAGERYERPWNCVSEAAVSWRAAGAKRGSKPVEMTGSPDLNELNSDDSRRWTYDDVFFPRDTIYDVKAGEIEVQLSEKKHKLFKKIESDWKN